jgi:hypothetical protein
MAGSQPADTGSIPVGTTGELPRERTAVQSSFPVRATRRLKFAWQDITPPSTSGPGQRSFKPRTRVRVPSGELGRGILAGRRGVEEWFLGGLIIHRRGFESRLRHERSGAVPCGGPRVPPVARPALSTGARPLLEDLRHIALAVAVRWPVRIRPGAPSAQLRSRTGGERKLRGIRGWPCWIRAKQPEAS